MGTPTMSDVHVSVPLTNLAIAYKNTSYVAKEILPWLSVDKDTGKYFIFGQEDFDIDNSERAPGTSANEVDYTLSQDTYSCLQHALRKSVPDEVQKNADAPLQPMMNATNFLTSKIMLEHENLIAAYLTNTAVMTNYTVPSTKWSTLSTSDPFADMQTAIDYIVKNAGVQPNLAIIGYEAMAILRNHPDLLDRIKYTEKGIVTADLLASIIFSETGGRVLVGSAVKRVGATKSYVWGKNMVFAYVSPTPQIDMPSFGYTFTAKSLGTVNFTNGYEVRTFRNEDKRCDVVEVTTNYDKKITALSAGYLLSAVVA